MGYTGTAWSLETFTEAFERTKSRGPDMTRIIPIGSNGVSGDGVSGYLVSGYLVSGYLGFHRLAIMGLDENGMQPFIRGANTVVCNGELYGFRTLKRQLERDGVAFRGDCDCELLLPLYEKYGFEMFARLDAEFALILFDGARNRLIAARDPIGIRPLFYAELPDGGIVFASEAKNLVGLADVITPFPPGHYYDGERFVRYADVGVSEPVCNDDLDVIFRTIRELLTAGIEKRLDADAPLGFLLSGGLDSSVVCAVAQRMLKKPIRTFAIGMNGDAIDLKYARETAAYIGSRHEEVIIDRKEVLRSLETVVSVLGTYDITTIRASIGMYLLCRAIRQRTDVRVLMTGEVSDELFGYKYTDFAPSPSAFQEEAAKRMRQLYMYDVLRADRCISVNSIEARVPFGDLAFVKYVMSIDPAKKMNVYGKGKYLLRRAFDGYLPDGGELLPRSILYREKAAFSDAVGHSMVDCIKQYADDKYTDTEYERLRARYDFATPFTKESLLYRQLFEKYYPRQAPMIADFWMPNRDWTGCNVTDPSARVLPNYGTSGQ
jgi:asparagine synthase (glutamine-hydrolysing)